MTKLNILQLGPVKDIQTKYGPKQKSAIKTKEYPDQWLSYWISKSTEEWSVGKEIEVEEVTPREYQGKTYYDIKLPKFQPNGAVEIMALSTKVDQVMTKLQIIIDHLSGKNRLDITSEGKKVPDFSEVDNDVPF